MGFFDRFRKQTPTSTSATTAAPPPTTPTTKKTDVKKMDGAEIIAAFVERTNRQRNTIFSLEEKARVAGQPGLPELPHLSTLADAAEAARWPTLPNYSTAPKDLPATYICATCGYDLHQDIPVFEGEKVVSVFSTAYEYFQRGTDLWARLWCPSCGQPHDADADAYARAENGTKPKLCLACSRRHPVTRWFGLHFVCDECLAGTSILISAKEREQGNRRCETCRESFPPRTYYTIADRNREVCSNPPRTDPHFGDAKHLGDIWRKVVSEEKPPVTECDECRRRHFCPVCRRHFGKRPLTPITTEPRYQAQLTWFERADSAGLCPDCISAGALAPDAAANDELIGQAEALLKEHS